MNKKCKFTDFKMLTEKLPLKKAAELFNVSERTIRRWEEKLGIYTPNSNYNRKINRQIANEIRKLDKSGNYSQKKLAEKFNISQPMIGKIINNVVYRTGLSGSAIVRIRLNL